MANDLQTLVNDLEGSRGESLFVARSLISTVFDALITNFLIAGTYAITGARARWIGCEPSQRQRIYFTNHTSHLDFMLLWSLLPKVLRSRTRPVAALDYWTKNAVRRYISEDVFHSVYVDREPGPPCRALDSVLTALDAGDSLIFFPEGTRGNGEGLQPFRSGIYHLVESRPEVELIPVSMDNNHRVLPKGSFLPLPVLCTATFGTPLHFNGEEKHAFIERLTRELQKTRTL